MDSDQHESKVAKQRASVNWLLALAFNRRVPENLLEPFFCSSAGSEQLKPQIVVGLGNAALYCQALATIYSDPAYQQLNHAAILQILARKSILAESEQPLTETTLIQTTPLRMQAHMCVIDAIMQLYAKEVTCGEKVPAAILRISGGATPTNLHWEQLLLLWTSHACAALKRRVQMEEMQQEQPTQGTSFPELPPLQDFSSLCDGAALCFLVAFYCPRALPWQAVRRHFLPTVEDSRHNVRLVQQFCRRHLPYNVFHMQPEDVTYMRGALKQNLILLLADLFNLFEIHPASCVCYPGPENNVGGLLNAHGVTVRRSFISHQPINVIPDLRAGFDPAPFQVLTTYDTSATTDGFVVHKSKGITTLSSMQRGVMEDMRGGGDDRGESNQPAGRPSNWEEQRRPSFAGRRSRRNSFSEESQLTIENFGGSQDQLNMVGRQPERKISTASMGEPAVAVRSSLADARGTLQLGDEEDPVPPPRREREREREREEHVEEQRKKTTWQQQQQQQLSQQEAEPLMKPSEDCSALGNIRLRLEEKRRQIEQEKRKVEAAMSKQLQKDPQLEPSLPIESKWSPAPVALVEPKRTPDRDHVTLEQYQQSIALMNADLTDIQADIQKLATQQNQIQAQTLQAQQLLQAQQIANILNQQYSSQQNLASATAYRPLHQHYGSSPHLPPNAHVTDAPAPAYGYRPAPPTAPPTYRIEDQFSREQPPIDGPAHFYLHDVAPSTPAAPQRRTWATSPAPNQFETITWKTGAKNGNPAQPAPGAFMLHGMQNGAKLMQNGGGQVHQQISQMIGKGAAPEMDEMAPQSISFIGDSDDQVDLELSLSKVHITSGHRTYRIPSPQRQHHPAINAGSFQATPVEDTSEKGFYISFDAEQPKRPKPPLRLKKSPKKEAATPHVAEASPPPVYEKVVVPAEELFRNQPPRRSPFGEERSSPPAVVKRAPPPREQRALIIGAQLNHLDADCADEMEKKKEKIMLLSLQRRQQQEETKARQEHEQMQRRDKEREKEEERARKKADQMARRAVILEQHRLKKAVEEAEREGKTLDRGTQELLRQQTAAAPKMRAQKVQRPRPKTIHVDAASVDSSKGSSSNLTGLSGSSSMRRDYYRGSQDSLAIRESPDEYPSTNTTPLGRRSSYKVVGAREPVTVAERGRTLSRISLGKSSGQGGLFRGRKSNSLMNLCDSDSGLGRATPPRRAPSPGMPRHLPSPSGPGSLPPGLMTKRRGFDDGSSDISSTPSSIMDYNGPRLYKQPATKSNRGILLNAVEYCVFPGAVNRDAKQKVLEKIARSEAKHFLILFRDAGCQFRALYSYWPENETVLKLYGTGPSQVDDVMFDKFFKYNSGGKCFTQVHTKHLTVTIDAFTIHNSLWQGKRVTLPNKKDMVLVI